MRVSGAQWVVNASHVSWASKWVWMSTMPGASTRPSPSTRFARSRSPDRTWLPPNKPWRQFREIKDGWLRPHAQDFASSFKFKCPLRLPPCAEGHRRDVSLKTSHISSRWSCSPKRWLKKRARSNRGFAGGQRMLQNVPAGLACCSVKAPTTILSIIPPWR